MNRDPMSIRDDPPPSLSGLLEREHAALTHFLQNHGSGILRYEVLEDLVQGVHLRAITAESRFVYQGDEPFWNWLTTLARNHIADRNGYWKAQKRQAGRMLRIVTSDSSSSSGVNPAASQPSPSSFAERKERFVVAMKAISVLLPRDRDILRMITEDDSIDDIARRHGLSYAAAQRARHRVVERFRKSFELIYGGPEGE